MVKQYLTTTSLRKDVSINLRRIQNEIFEEEERLKSKSDIIKKALQDNGQWIKPKSETIKKKEKK